MPLKRAESAVQMFASQPLVISACDYAEAAEELEHAHAQSDGEAPAAT